LLNSYKSGSSFEPLFSFSEITRDLIDGCAASKGNNGA
jgi:hypothetical protein